MMPSSLRSISALKPSFSAGALVLLLAALALAGGASRAEALGQLVVRGIAWAILIALLLTAERPRLANARPVAIVLGAAVMLALLQIVPLPPAIWQVMPGREALNEIVAAGGPVPVWRPWSLVPGATVNAASSLIVPVVTLLLMVGLTERERGWLPAVILGFVFGLTLIGLLQFSGASFNNAFVNDTPGQVGGTFANRNHFALFLALGCLVAPVWAVAGERASPLRGVLALGLVLIFVLTILATGSRAGIVLGALGCSIGLAIAREGVKRTLRRYPRWVYPALLTGIVGIVVLFVLISLFADRAVSINRVFTVDQGQDMRSRGLPTVLEMVRTYFPLGSGLGGFDPIFRLHEPFALLKPTYFNHAHNDLIEIVLDAGLPGICVLLSALIWWGFASYRAWKAGASGLMARLGSAVVLLVLIASAFDYPARTPIMMSMLVIAGVWLCSAGNSSSQALPRSDRHL